MGEEQNAPECPFCGSRRVKVVTKWLGRDMYRRFGGYATCLNCRCRSPLVQLPDDCVFDVRNDRASAEAKARIENDALETFVFKSLAEDNRNFHLEPS